MAQRKRVGLVFSYNEEWIAGSYYILNIVQALKTIPESLQPELVILTESIANFEYLKSETNYPYLEYVPFPFSPPRYSIVERAINKACRILKLKHLIVKTPKGLPKIDMLYPKQINGLFKNLKSINWIPDFQEDHLPQFFSAIDIKNRKDYQKNILTKSDIVVFSSENAKQDFDRLYPQSKSRRYVLPFAVTLPDFSHENIDELKEKYELTNHYFFVPNQFWAHKNHIIVLKAIKRLSDRGLKINIAMSGKENDYRNVDNFKQLKNFVFKNDIETHIRFLGFISRTEQLCMMKHAIAIIQPSLFEGWSTVVEDAKALNKLIVLSNLEVHVEQINENVMFFDPKDELELSNILEELNLMSYIVKQLDYSKNIEEFGQRFYDLIALA
ncbi:glycosyltransferase family 1 protein [uncultured Psychroserpens sp.]|uniref:glycosyltransferase family 4 protein n=1 Tax=uncultured Psychroserpens sp. TaxID=255436 RepID=UPI002636AABA|nr:glycosyltransferase family 1 protein [uncultured Psychroserpens sp.]